MISGQKCSLEAELVAGKFGNPTLLTIVQCTLCKNEINTSFFNRYFHVAFTVRRILSRVCIIGPIFFIADNDNNFEFIGDTDLSLSPIKFNDLYD